MQKFFFPSYNGIRCYNNGVMAQGFVENSHNKMCSSKTKNKIIFFNIPFLRGLQFFMFGLIAFFATLFNVMPDSSEKKTKTKKLKKIDFNSKKNKKINKINKKNKKNEKKVKKTLKFKENLSRYFISFILFITLILGVFFLGYFPAKLGWLLIGVEGSFLLRNLIIAIFKLLFYFLMLAIIRVIPFMQDFFRFNGACNEIYYGGDNIKKNSKLDYFMPLNFLNFVIFVFGLDIFVVTLIGANINFLFNFLISLAVFIISVSLGYEILFLLEHSKKNKVKNLSLITNFFITAKPRLTHEEIAVASLMEANLLRTQKGRMNMQKTSENKSYSSMYAEMKTKLLKVQGVEIADLDWIIATILGKNRAEIKLLTEVTEKQYNDIAKAVNRRANHEPLSSIFGFVEFYGLKFNVNKKVLSPRMETEILVEQALTCCKNFKKPTVLDLCTGSGAIAVAIAKNSKSEVTGIDISKGALDVATINAKNNDVKIQFLQSDLFNNLKKRAKYDIIVSNPPYIKSKDIKKLDEEVRKYDPEIALNGGEDGLDFYRKIISESQKYLNKNGFLLFEVGYGQAGVVKNLMKKEGFIDIKVVKDYGKIERVVYGRFIK